MRIQANPDINNIFRVEIVTQYVVDCKTNAFMTCYSPRMEIGECIKNHMERFEIYKGNYDKH